MIDRYLRHTNRQLISTRAILPYLAITFSLAWGIFLLFALMPERIAALFGEISARHPLFILAVYAPAIAALIVVLVESGTRGLRGYLKRLSLWRCSIAWYAYLVFGIPLVYYAGAALEGDFLTGILPSGGVGAMLGAIAFMLVLGPMEEFGWRGVALPLLQRRLAPFWAGLVLGAIWGLWHLPAFFLSGTPQSAWGFTPFLIGSIAISVILTPLFNRSGGSILLAVLYHFQLNNPLWPDAQPYDNFLFVAVAAIVVWLERKSMFQLGAGVSEVVPR